MPLARRVAASLMLCCAQPCQCFLSQPVANPHSRSVTPNRPTFAQRWQWDFDHTNPALLRTAQVLTFLTVYVKSSSRYTVLCKFLLFGKCSEIVNSFCHFEVHFLLTTFPDRAPATAETATLLWRPRKPLYPKNTGFRARECFHPWIHESPNCCTSQPLDDWWLTIWCGWHDDGNADHDNRS